MTENQGEPPDTTTTLELEDVVMHIGSPRRGKTAAARDECDDIAAILHPAPAPLPPHADDEEKETFNFAKSLMRRDRSRDSHRLRDRRDRDQDPVLAALREQARIKAEADRRIRELLAYAREFVAPRGYTLDALAAQTGMSYSAVRGAYDQHDVEAVAEATGRRRTQDEQPVAESALAQLVGELAEHTAVPARQFVADVAAALHQQGWTPYPPVARTPNPRTAKRYIRWTRSWPHGTTVGLYQEPSGVLSTHAKMPTTDPRYFTIENDDGGGVAELPMELAKYAERITRYDAQLAAARETRSTR
jgi:hypothetical protein